MRRTFVILSIAALTAVGCGDALESKSCTLLGCNSQVSTTLDASSVAGGALDSKVIACRNGVCTEGTIDQDAGGLRCSFPTSADGRGPSCRARQGSTSIFDFRFVLGDNEAKDGDTYSFTITGKAGTNPVKKEGAVTYTVSRPNGPDCEPVCSQATLG